MEGYGAASLSTLHPTAGDGDGTTDLSSGPDVGDTEGEEFSHSVTGVNAENDQCLVAQGVASLESGQKRGDFVIGEGAASGMVHAMEIKGRSEKMFRIAEREHFGELASKPMKIRLWGWHSSPGKSSVR